MLGFPIYWKGSFQEERGSPPKKKITNKRNKKRGWRGDRKKLEREGVDLVEKQNYSITMLRLKIAFYVLYHMLRI